MAYNVVVCGIGGRGVISLASIIARAAAIEGRAPLMSELHGLAMRFGPLEAHVRFTTNKEKIHSPIIPQAEAQLILALEPLEALRSASYAAPGAAVVIDNYPSVPNIFYIRGINYPSIDEVVKKLEALNLKAFVFDAARAAKAITGTPAAANVYLLGRALALGLLPLRLASIEGALAQVVSPHLLEANKAVLRKAVGES